MAGEIGYGLTLGYCTTSGGSYTAVANPSDVTPPEYVIEAVDKTSHDSTNAFRDKTPGLVDPGVITFKALLSKAQYTALESQLRVNQFWKITWPMATGESTASKVVAAGWLSKLKTVLPLAGATEIEGEVTVTGKPTFTSGS